MVIKTKWKGQDVFECPECKLLYSDENIAKSCEEFCKKHHGCSLEITKNAVNI